MARIWFWMLSTIPWYRQWRYQVLHRWWFEQKDSTECPALPGDERFSLLPSGLNILDLVFNEQKYDLLEELIKKGLSSLFAPQDIHNWNTSKSQPSLQHVNKHLGQTPLARAFFGNDLEALKIFGQDRTLDIKKVLSQCSSVPFYHHNFLYAQDQDIFSWLLENKVALAQKNGVLCISYHPPYVEEDNKAYPIERKLIDLIFRQLPEDKIPLYVDMLERLYGKEVLGFSIDFWFHRATHMIFLNRLKSLEFCLERGELNVNDRLNNPHESGVFFSYLLSVGCLFGNENIIDTLLKKGALWEVNGDDIGQWVKEYVLQHGPTAHVNYALSLYERYRCQKMRDHLSRHVQHASLPSSAKRRL